MTATVTRYECFTARHLLAAIVMAAVGVWVTAEAWVEIAEHARDEEHSHILLVPFVAAWLVWVRWERLRYCRPVGTMIGPLLLATGWGLSAFGFYNGHMSLWHAGSVLVVVGCVFSVLGRQVFFRFLPAVAVLAFLVPVPGSLRVRIAQPLQLWTSQIAEFVLQVTGAAVERSGNLLTVNGTAVNIVEACNGLRMVFALILVSFAFAYGLPLRNGVRLTLLLLSPLAAILCNVVRILPTVYIYGSPSISRQAAEAFHDYSGWVMLPIALLILIGLMKLLQWASVPVMKFRLASQGA